MAQGFAVLAAAKVAAAGGNMSDVIKAAENVLPKLMFSGQWILWSILEKAGGLVYHRQSWPPGYR